MQFFAVNRLSLGLGLGLGISDVVIFFLLFSRVRRFTSGVFYISLC